MSSSFNFLDIANSINASPLGGRHCVGTWDKMESARSRLCASNNERRQHVNSARPTRNKNGTPEWFVIVSNIHEGDLFQNAYLRTKIHPRPVDDTLRGWSHRIKSRT